MATWARKDSTDAGYNQRRVIFDDSNQTVYDEHSYGSETRGDATFARSIAASTWATRNSRGTYWGSGDSFTLGFGEASVLDVTDDVIEMIYRMAGSCSSMKTSCREGLESACVDMDPCTCEDDDIYSMDEDDSFTAAESTTENGRSETRHQSFSNYNAPRRGSSDPGRSSSSKLRTSGPKKGGSLYTRVPSAASSQFDSLIGKDRYEPSGHYSEFHKRTSSRDTFSEKPFIMSRSAASEILRKPTLDSYYESPKRIYSQSTYDSSYQEGHQPHHSLVEERDESYSKRSTHQNKSEQRDIYDISDGARRAKSQSRQRIKTDQDYGANIGIVTPDTSPQSSRKTMSPSMKYYLAQKNARTVRTKAHTEYPETTKKKSHFRIRGFRKRCEA